MLSNEDRAEVMKMIAEAKEEMRREVWDASNRNHEDKGEMKQNTADNTDAILELADIIGGA